METVRLATETLRLRTDIVPHVVRPQVGHDDRYFWDGVAERTLLLRRCANCSRLQQPPSPMCPACGSTEWVTQPASGHASVHSWIVSVHPTQPDEAPRIVALVDLDEGVRLVTNLEGIDPADVRNGMPVELNFTELDGLLLPQFRPAGGQA
jgi:uncharacterized OB-fold protein